MESLESHHRGEEFGCINPFPPTVLQRGKVYFRLMINPNHKFYLNTRKKYNKTSACLVAVSSFFVVVFLLFLFILYLTHWKMLCDRRVIWTARTAIIASSLLLCCLNCSCLQVRPSEPEWWNQCQHVFCLFFCFFFSTRLRTTVEIKGTVGNDQ